MIVISKKMPIVMTPARMHKECTEYIIRIRSISEFLCTEMYNQLSGMIDETICEMLWRAGIHDD